MAGDIPGGTINFGANADDVEAELERAVKNAVNAMSAELRTGLGRVLRKITSDFQSGFGGQKATNGFRDATAAAEKLESSIQAIQDQTEAAGKTFGASFDPKNLAGFQDQLIKLVELQSKLDEEIAKTGGGEAYAKLSSQLNSAIKTGVVATRELSVAAARASDEAQRNVERNARQASRVAKEESRQTTSRYVVDAQTQASAARDAAKAQIEASRASSRQRVAIIQAAARTIATIERGLSTVFRGTSNVISAAFGSIRRAAQVTSTSVSQTFRSSTRNMEGDVTNVSKAYSNSFRNSTNTVRNEVNQQSSIINNFAEKTSRALGGISLGGLAAGGILGLGIGKALTGGFERATTLETASRGLEFLLGNAEKAKLLLQQVTEVVTGTPFRLDQFAKGASRLVAFNVEAERIPGILTAIGDAAALSGKDADQVIETLIRVTGQASTTGKLYGDSIISLSEAGVPALQILGNAFNKATGDVQELLTDGTIPAKDALDALFKGIEEGSDGINGATRAFGGLAKGLGTTLSGSLANLNTAFSRAGANVITTFTPAITAAAGAATAAVDLIGSAFAALAKAIQETPTFQLILAGINKLAEGLKKAKTALAPVFEFLAEGAALAAQVAGGFLLLKNVPGILTAIGQAARVVLSPFNLTVAAVILISSAFKRLYDDSQPLRIAFGLVGNALQRIGIIVSELARDSFQALVDLFRAGGGGIQDGAKGLAETLTGFLIPALETVANFLTDKVIPPLRRFAGTVRDDVLPVLGTILRNAIEKAKEVFQSLSDFIRDEVVPVVGPILQRAVQLGTSAFRAFYDFAAGTLVPFIKSNLTPVLAGLGAAAGALALTGGNIPLAGLAGIGTGIAVALANPEIRNALIGNIKKGVEGARQAIANLFDGVTLAKVGTSVLKVANKIGQVLGDALSDRRLVAVAGGIVLAAAAIAAAFVAGLAEGIIRNVPDLIDLLGDALSSAVGEALSAVAKDPKIALLAAGAFFGAQAIAKVITQGRTTGRVLAQAVADGVVTSSTTGAGSGAKGLLNGLFGGTNAIRQSASEVGQKYGQALRTAIANEVRLVEKLGGKLPNEPVGLGPRIPGETSAQENKRLAESLRRLKGITAEYGVELGEAAVQGTRLRDGLGQIAKGNFRQGFTQLGVAIKASGKEIGAAAGIVAGAAFATSFVSQALFDAKSSGAEKLTSGFSVLATGATTFAALGGGAQGAVGATAAVGIGLLSAKFKESGERAKQAAADAKEYASAITQAGDAAGGAAAAINEVFANRLENASDRVRESLAEASFNYQNFTFSVRNGSAEDSINRITGAVLDAGGSFADVTAVAQFLNGEVSRIENGMSRAATSTELLTTTATTGLTSADIAAAALTQRLAETEIVTKATTAAADAYKSKLNELNEARLEPLREALQGAKDEADKAGSAADTAREAFKALLEGPQEANTLRERLDEAVLAVDGFGSQLAGLDPATALDPGPIGAKYREALSGVSSEVADLLADAPTLSDAQALGQTIKDGLAGQEYGQAVTDIIDTQLANWDPDAASVKNNLQTAFETAIDQVDTAQKKLDVQLDIKPETIAAIKTAAEGAGKEAADTVVQGYNETLGGEADQSGSSTFIENSIKAALAALDANSPSKKFAELGQFAVAGYNQGIKEGVGDITGVSRGIGVASYQGVVAGLRSGTGSIAAAARALGKTLANALRAELEVESPSKVTEEIGNQTVQGFIAGIDDSLPLVERIAFTAASKVTGAFRDLGTSISRAIGTGFASGGSDFIGQVGSTIDEAFDAAMTKADQFKQIGQTIAKGLFSNQGNGPLGITGGGSAEVALQQAYLKIIDNARSVSSAILKQSEDAAKALAEALDKGDKYTGADPNSFLTYDPNSVIGRENTAAFLAAGANVRSYAEQLLAAGRGLDSVVFETTAYRDQLVEAARATGATEAQITAMVNTLGLSNQQLKDFVKNVNDVAKATSAATKEAEKALAAQKAADEAEKQRQEAEKEAEKRAQEAEKAAQEAEREAEKAAREAERRAEEAQREAEKAAQEAEDRAREKAEADAKAAAEAARIQSIAPQVFRDLIVQSPSGDPEAVALATANRVAFAIRR